MNLVSCWLRVAGSAWETYRLHVVPAGGGSFRGCAGTARGGARREHAVGDEVHTRAVLRSRPGSGSAHPRCPPLHRPSDRSAGRARAVPGWLVTSNSYRSAGRSSPAGSSLDSSLNLAVSVKNTLVPSLEALWKCTSCCPSPGSGSFVSARARFGRAVALRRVQLDRFAAARMSRRYRPSSPSAVQITRLPSSEIASRAFRPPASPQPRFIFVLFIGIRGPAGQHAAPAARIARGPTGAPLIQPAASGGCDGQPDLRFEHRVLQIAGRAQEFERPAKAGMRAAFAAVTSGDTRRVSRSSDAARHSWIFGCGAGRSSRT